MKNTITIAIILIFSATNCFAQSNHSSLTKKHLNVEYHLFLSSQFMYKNVNNYLYENNFARVTPEQIGVVAGFNYDILKKLNIGIVGGLSSNFGLFSMTTKSLVGNLYMRYKMTKPEIIPYLAVGTFTNTIWSRSENNPALSNFNSITLRNDWITLSLGALSTPDDRKFQVGLEVFASFGNNPWITNDTELSNMNVADRVFGIKVYGLMNSVLF